MSNVLLNVNQITNAALPILHQKLNFVGSINRTYDDSYARSGAKIGSTLRIRLPNQFTTTTGPALSTQDVAENNTTLTVATQRHVDVNLTSAELTMNIFDFSQQVLEPAMAVLAAQIEADAMSMFTSVYNVSSVAGSAQTFRNVLNARKILLDNLAPPDSNQMCRLNTQDNVDLVDQLKGLFNDQTQIKRQYSEGVMGRTAGLEFAQNTIIPAFTPGARNTAYLINGASQTGSSLIVDTGSGAMVVGDVFTIAGVYRVHPETKATTTTLQQFVVTAAYSGGSGTISISPAIVTTGATQNVSAAPADNAAITFVGTASTATGQSIVYHRDAFAFATADLIMPEGVDFAKRAVQDGISLRIVRQYDINNDRYPCRMDVLYGYNAIRPQLAVRTFAN